MSLQDRRYEGEYNSRRYNSRDDLRAAPEADWAYMLAGTLFVAAGGYLIFRGATGGPEAGSVQGERTGSGVQVRESVTVDKPASELYRYWRNLENVGRTMTHLETVRELNDKRSQWVAKGPLGSSVTWDALITDDREDELIAWRSVDDSDIPNEGAVRFSPTGRDQQQTEVLVSLTYHPPGGALGAAVAKLFGGEPAQQISDDLGRFKREMESGALSSQDYSARQSATSRREEDAPPLGVPGSSSGLRTDNLQKNELQTKDEALPAPNKGSKGKSK